VNRYNQSLDEYIIGNYQYICDDSETDFVKDNIRDPIGSGYEEGDHFGLESSKYK